MSQPFTLDELTPITIGGVTYEVGTDGNVHIPVSKDTEMTVSLKQDGLKRKDWYYSIDWEGHGHFIHVSYDSLVQGLELLLHSNEDRHE